MDDLDTSNSLVFNASRSYLTPSRVVAQIDKHLAWITPDLRQSMALKPRGKLEVNASWEVSRLMAFKLIVC